MLAAPKLARERETFSNVAKVHVWSLMHLHSQNSKLVQVQMQQNSRSDLIIVRDRNYLSELLRGLAG